MSQAILALLADLYGQVMSLQAQVEALTAELAKRPPAPDEPA
jgi:hypothetical protein